MKKYIISILVLIVNIMSFNAVVLGQYEKDYLSGEYLGQTTPKLIPLKFAPNIVSTVNEYEFGSVFSRDGNEFYYGVDLGGKAEIRYMLRVGDRWDIAKKLDLNSNYSFNDPFLSPDGNRLYYISDMPLEGTGEKKDIDIWYSERTGTTWSEPINAGKKINSLKEEYYVSFTNNGTMYFSSNRETSDSTKWDFDIFYAKLKDGMYQEPVKLCSNINSSVYEADVFISPDESYIIFCSAGREGYGEGDLYISFNENGSWTKAVNMGDKINTKGHEFCPFVSCDGKYFFYTSNKDIYWVSTEILNLFRGNSR